MVCTNIPTRQTIVSTSKTQPEIAMFKATVICIFIVAIFVIIFKNYSSDILNLVSQSPGSCHTKDVTFSTKLNLKADIYYHNKSAVCHRQNAKNINAQTPVAPSVIFVHGGSWRNGDKSTYKFVADFFTSHGYNVIIPSYRLFPSAAYPEFIQDLESFFLWLQEEGETYNINTSEIHLIGHSAGAFNAASYLFNNTYKKPMVIESFIGLAGPYDFFLPATQDKDYQPVFSRNDAKFNDKSSLPARQLPNSTAAITLKRALFLHGEKDSTVTPKNPANIHPLVLKSDIQSEYKIYKGKGHIQLVTGLANITFLGFSMQDDILAFMAK